MKRVFVLLLFINSLFARTLIDGVAMKVNDEIITLYEIYSISNSMNISRDDAIERLIKERLKDSEIKRLKINVDDMEISKEMERIAKENNMRLFEFKNELRSKYGTTEHFENEIKKRLKEEKLAQEIVDEKLKNIDEAKLKEYYQKNIQDFSVAKRATVIKYFSNNIEPLESLINGFMNRDVSFEEESIDLEKIHPSIASLINRTKSGSFTQIIPVSGVFVTFFVKEKSEVKELPFEESKNIIYQKMIKDEEQRVLKEHFDKLRAEAKIEVLKLP